MSEPMVEISVSDLGGLQSLVMDFVRRSIDYERYLAETISHSVDGVIEVEEGMMDDPEFFLRILEENGEHIDEMFVDVCRKSGLYELYDRKNKELVEDMIATDPDIPF